MHTPKTSDHTKIHELPFIGSTNAVGCPLGSERHARCSVMRQKSGKISTFGKSASACVQAQGSWGGMGPERTQQPRGQPGLALEADQACVGEGATWRLRACTPGWHGRTRTCRDEAPASGWGLSTG